MREEKEEIDRFLHDDDDEDEDSEEEEFESKNLDEMDDQVQPPEPLDEDELKGLKFEKRSFKVIFKYSNREPVFSVKLIYRKHA